MSNLREFRLPGKTKKMKTNIRFVLVRGIKFTVWSDPILRGTFAEFNGEVKALRTSGYLSNPASVERAIKSSFINLFINLQK